MNVSESLRILLSTECFLNMIAQETIEKKNRMIKTALARGLAVNISLSKSLSDPCAIKMSTGFAEINRHLHTTLIGGFLEKKRPGEKLIISPFGPSTKQLPKPLAGIARGKAVSGCPTVVGWANLCYTFCT
jgi:hypothetical protein